MHAIIAVAILILVIAVGLSAFVVYSTREILAKFEAETRTRIASIVNHQANHLDRLERSHKAALVFVNDTHTNIAASSTTAAEQLRQVAAATEDAIDALRQIGEHFHEKSRLNTEAVLQINEHLEVLQKFRLRT